MSLSKDILNGDLKAVKRRVSLGALVNDFDPYGYTPLIISLMTQQTDIFDYLLNHGADVNRPDLFGQPPLHWAVKLEQPDLCARLLKKGAFSNTLSSYGEPLLVYPLLKKNRELIDVLEKSGTHRLCAEDYIFTKYIGHHFELKGFGCYKNYNNILSLVDYQGFRLEFSLQQLYRQFENYLALEHKLPVDHQKDYLDILERAIKLRSIKKVFPTQQEQECAHYLKKMNLIPMAFDGHAVSLVYTDHFVALCDRAQHRSKTVMFFKLPDKINFETATYFLYGKKSQLYWQELPESMGWELIDSLPVSHQKVGNCSWANIETAPVLIAGLMQLEQKKKLDSKILMSFFDRWIDWSQSFLLKQAALRIQQLQGDRRFSLALTLLNVILQHGENKTIHDSLSFLLKKEFYQKEFKDILKQHIINNGEFTDSASKIIKYIEK